MKKLKLKGLEISSGNVLSREELKLLMGGDDGFGSGSNKGSTTGSTKRSDVPFTSGKHLGTGNTSTCITSC